MKLSDYSRRLKTVGVVLAITFCTWLVFDQSIAISRARKADKQNIHRFPVPYIEFKGQPYARDHNEHGYRYDSKQDRANSLKIAFFGGSTGYFGKPPIATLLQQELESTLSMSVQVVNFSVVSSNHRQHLHNIIETRKIFQPDIIMGHRVIVWVKTGSEVQLAPAISDTKRL